MKKAYAILIGGIMALSSSLAQNKEIDSLKQILERNIADTARVEVLYLISGFYLEVNLDSAMLYGKRTYQISSTNKSKKVQYSGLERMGSILWRRGDAEKSIEFLLEALQTVQLVKDSALISLVYFDLGNAYYSESDDKTAVSYYLKSLEGQVRYGMKGRMLMTIGSIYLKKGKLDSALSYAQESYEIFNSIGHSSDYLASPIRYSIYAARYLSSSLNLLGDINMQSGDANLAHKFYKMGVAAGYANQNLSGVTDNNLSIARIFKLKRNIDSAYAYGIVAYRIAKELNSPYKIEEITSFMKDLFTENNKIDSAFKYQTIMIAAKDSILNIEKKRQIQNLSFAEQQRHQDLMKSKIEFQNKIKLYAAAAGMLILVIVSYVLYSRNRNKEKANAMLSREKEKVETTLQELRFTQTQLIQSEKMASLGEMTAGIAHEIQNPLNFVNNFSEINRELVDELNEEMEKGNLQKARSIAKDVQHNEEKINQHGKRVDAIVKSMLQHSRESSGQKETTDINALADEYLRLSYYGVRAKDKDFNAILKTDFGQNVGKINIVLQDIGRVLLNLYNNAFYAVSEKKKQLIEGYEPKVSVSTKRTSDKVEIRVMDNGNGIPDSMKEKIFQPFFTTKPAGQGTGLGLSLSYDIITKEHGGSIAVETKEGEYAEFVIRFPVA